MLLQFSSKLDGIFILKEEHKKRTAGFSPWTLLLHLTSDWLYEIHLHLYEFLHKLLYTFSGIFKTVFPPFLSLSYINALHSAGSVLCHCLCFHVHIFLCVCLLTCLCVFRDFAFRLIRLFLTYYQSGYEPSSSPLSLLLFCFPYKFCFTTPDEPLVSAIGSSCHLYSLMTQT